MSINIKELKAEIIDQYFDDDGNIPWIIGFSGGKDSTMLLQIVWQALLSEPTMVRTRKIYVVCNNTLVENPKIIQYTDKVLKLIEKAALDQSIPLLVQRTTPQLEDSFWVNLLGKGYPAPNNTFRWCTDRLKINPTTEFIKSTISNVGEAIILLGTRKDESSSRSRSIEKNKGDVESSRLRKHPLPNASVYAPITDVTTQEVWQFLLQNPSPWGADNRGLVSIYNNATGGDCPLIIDDTVPSCGNSRFGCWVCTVVKKDKSMSALIDNGEEWMEPMLDFRDMLVEFRNHPEWRESTRRNGAEGPGAYTAEKRAYMLEKLLQAQKSVRAQEPDVILINYQELVSIQIIWHRDGIFNYNVASIYNKVYGTDLQSIDFVGDQVENEILKEVCEPGDVSLINELLDLQKSKFLLVNNYGLQNDLETHLDRFIKKAVK